MFPRHKTKGIVINTEDRGEYDRIITVYTELFGKIKLLGKSIRKGSSKLKSGIEPFSFVEIEFIEGRYQKRLTDVKVINPYLKTNKNFAKISFAEIAIKDLDLLMKGEEKDIKIWNLLKTFFVLLEKKENDFIFYSYFFWNLIFELGYGPELYFCCCCRKKIIPENLLISIIDGGLICSDCSKNKKTFSVKESSIKLIRMFLEGKIKTIEKIKIDNREKEDLWIISRSYLQSIEKD